MQVNLKIIEAGMKGLPIFVQNIHPYTDEAEGIFHVDDWKQGIEIAKNLGDVESLGKSLREYVLSRYDLNKVNQLRIDRL
jgi:hypothetical protein